eukprot:113554-Ditylum_brightwellii.AAC.1
MEYLTTHSQSSELVKVNQKMEACESKINKLITYMDAVTSKLDTTTSCIAILGKKKLDSVEFSIMAPPTLPSEDITL